MTQTPSEAQTMPTDIKDKYVETSLRLAVGNPTGDRADDALRAACRHKLNQYLAPLTGSLHGFREHATDPSIIVGHWCEDESTFEIVVPHQLRSRIMVLLQLAKELRDAH